VREIFFAHTHMSFIRKAPHEWDTYTYAPYTLMARCACHKCVRCICICVPFVWSFPNEAHVCVCKKNFSHTHTDIYWMVLVPSDLVTKFLISEF